ncbi:hypothetical protein AUO95_15585 [Corynebacterium glutamicum]|nr:hypothetical protein AUO95_15585 [Corynebacterium glutamicum]
MISLGEVNRFHSATARITNTLIYLKICLGSALVMAYAIIGQLLKQQLPQMKAPTTLKHFLTLSLKNVI